MEKMLRFPEAVQRASTIDEWLDKKVNEFGAIARKWFTYMRQRGDDVRELLHDGHPTACVGDAAFGYVNVFRDHVNVGFFFGAELPDPHRLLEGTGKRMRHVKVWPGREPDPKQLSALIDDAYRDIRRRLQAGS